MKKLLSCLAIIALLLGLSTVAVSAQSDPTDDPATWDTSIFDAPEVLVGPGVNCFLVECGDAYFVNLVHYTGRDGAQFFLWGGGDEKMPSNAGYSCLTSGVPMPIVVFWDGVPNLPFHLLYRREGDTHDVYIPDSVTEIDEDCFVMNSTITLHFTKNNAVALTYAQNRGMAFEVMDGERALGDVNFDKSTDMKDALALRKSIAKLPAAYEIYSTDLNGDGNVDMKDVLTLRKQIANAA